jgi:hypothetical protein
MITLNDSREEKNLANARAESRDRIDAGRRENIARLLKAYPEIGLLNCGMFYVILKNNKYVESKWLTRVIDAIEEAK